MQYVHNCTCSSDKLNREKITAKFPVLYNYYICKSNHKLLQITIQCQTIRKHLLENTVHIRSLNHSMRAQTPRPSVSYCKKLSAIKEFSATC